MHEVMTGRAATQSMDWEALYGMYRLRDTVFHKRLGWDVQSVHGVEQDDYDALDPTYVIARRQRREVEACTRLLPTTGAYMLKDTFPELLRGETAPTEDGVWEISRFAAAPASDDDCRQANASEATLQMMDAIINFADRNGVHSFVTATTTALERLLRRLGIPMRRFGDGKSVQVGKERSVACWIFIDDECRRAVRGDDFDIGELRRAA